MSDKMKDLLRQYSVEAGEAQPDEDHSQIGAEEITVVTDETTTELEEALADTAEQVDKLEDSDAAAEKIVDAVESMESNLDQLRAMATNGKALDHGAMRWYIQNLAISVEARGLPGSVVETEVNALQESFESAQLDDYTTEAEEKTGNVIMRLLRVLAAALSNAKTAIAQFFATIGRSAGAIKTGGQQIQRLAGKLKGDVKKTEIKASGYRRLVEGGKVEPSAVLKGLRDKWRSEMLPHVLKPMQDALAPVTSNLASANPVADLAEKVKAHIATSKKIELPGGASAELKVEGETVKFAMNAPTGDGVEKTAPLTKAELQTLGTELIATGSFMTSAKDSTNQFVKEVENVLKAIEKVAGKDKADGAKERKEAVSAAVTAATKLVNTGKSIAPAYIGYLSKTAKDAYNFGKASLGAYGAKPKEESAAGEANQA